MKAERLAKEKVVAKRNTHNETKLVMVAVWGAERQSDTNGRDERRGSTGDRSNDDTGLE